MEDLIENKSRINFFDCLMAINFTFYLSLLDLLKAHRGKEDGRAYFDKLFGSKK